jgi:hypothetical protein
MKDKESILKKPLLEKVIFVRKRAGFYHLLVFSPGTLGALCLYWVVGATCQPFASP